ncbi:MAG: hypothetical protein SFY69_11305 [Planctomycetota bacterium]|nr:hypothetical protein [Planctomycetota bacterium]
MRDEIREAIERETDALNTEQLLGYYRRSPATSAGTGGPVPRAGLAEFFAKHPVRSANAQ